MGDKRPFAGSGFAGETECHIWWTLMSYSSRPHLEENPSDSHSEGTGLSNSWSDVQRALQRNCSSITIPLKVGTFSRLIHSDSKANVIK